MVGKSGFNWGPFKSSKNRNDLSGLIVVVGLSSKREMEWLNVRHEKILHASLETFLNDILSAS
jgi:hypothetical protein